MNLIEYPDVDMMMIDVANHLAGELNEAVMINGQASFAVPGGTTPGPIFDVLCAADLEWDKVTVLPTDERWVPETSEHSNARLIRARLLTSRAAAATFLPLYRDGAAPEDCVDALSDQMQPHLPISVLVLGMGADMHTASIFPGPEGAESTTHSHGNSPIFYPIKKPGLAPFVPRMTLSIAALNGAMNKHIVITGAEKRAALMRAQELADPVLAPVSAVLNGATVHWAE